MSIGIMMNLVTYLIITLFSATLICSDQNMVPLRTFKISENITYDCIDIYKQPGLDHPLLKNHTIQMKPLISKHELKIQIGHNKTYKNNIGCPNGTVPILKNSKEYITNSRLFTEKYFHPLSGDTPGTHIAGVRSSNGPFRGVKAMFSIHNVNVEKDQASYGQIYIGSGSKNQVNFIQTGWMINPSLFGNKDLWSYGFWKGKDRKGCYNTACPGFGQISKEVPISQPLNQPGESMLRYSIHQDKQTKNWWLTKITQKGPKIDVGYWPKELISLMDNGANMVGVGGSVQASPQGSSPPMGNGKFPTGDGSKSAMFTNVEAMNSNYELHRIDSFSIEKLVDSPKCYGLRIGTVPVPDFYFNYGGPGGNSCGV